MQIHARPLVMVALVLALVAACSKQQESAPPSETPPAANPSAEDAQGKTTTFDEQSAPAPAE
jgi:hypothetical protein